MTDPIIHEFPGGTLKFIAKGDLYHDWKTGHVAEYTRTKLIFRPKRSAVSLEIPKDAWDALQVLLQVPEVQKRMRFWK